MRSRMLPALLLLALSVPIPPSLAQAPTTEPSVVGPDADGAYLLRFAVERVEAGPASLGLDVLRSNGEGDLATTRELDARSLAAGTNDVEVSFLPAEGPGRYAVTLRADGVAVGSVAFDVDDAGATGNVAFDVPDEPTYLNLTSDEVNAANKTKSPGETLVTRAKLADGNGLGDVRAVTWKVEGPSFLESGALPVASDLELRYDRAPLPAGDYRLTLRAARGETTLATADRTFRIREVAPTFVSGTLEDVTPDENVTQATAIVLADRNGFPTAPLETRVYRGSTRAEGGGFAATLGAFSSLADANGSARAAVPLTLTVPARAAPGAYRASIYADGSLLASLPFQVLDLPRLASVDATTDGGSLLLTLRGSGDGTLRAQLDGAEASASFVNGSGVLRLDPSQRNATLAWNVSLHARADGPPLETRSGLWSAPYDGPALSITALHARRLPAAWRIDADGTGVAGATATVSFTRWDGAEEARLAARVDGERLRVDGPADLPAGRYTGRLVLTWANGTASETTWTFDAGPWVQLSLGEATVTGRVARVPIANDGGLVVRRIVVEAEPAANLSLEIGNATLVPKFGAASGSASGAGAGAPRAAFSGFALAPGEEAVLRVELPGGPLASGRHDVRLRVLARVELA